MTSLVPEGHMGCIKCHLRWEPELTEEGYPIWQHECVADLAERVRKLEEAIKQPTPPKQPYKDWRRRMSKTGYFINANNYLPCEHCSDGYDKMTMLCIKPYYHHSPNIILRRNPPITGITTA